MHEARSAECIDVSEWPSHNARYIMLKSDYNMNYLVLVHYEAEIYKRSSEAGGGESCIVEIYAWFCMSRA